jgi:HAE1 family hydrophobic/amphiphilic exporter-1
MGTTVIGGMLAASAIGIFLIPAIFYLVEKMSGARNVSINLALAPVQGD